MPNNSLQDQLGLWLAVQQSNQMTWSTWNVTNYTDFNGNQWIAVWAHKDFVPNINYDHTMDSVGYQGEVIPSWYINQSFSAPSAVSAPVSTTNIGIWDTFSGITPKKKGNIAESTTQVAPITPVTPQIPWAPLSRQDIIAKNAQQIADNKAGIRRMQPIEPVAPIAPMSPSAIATGLQGAELQAYNQLTPQEQKTFQALATQGIKAQTDYLAQSKASQEYNKEQERLYQEVDANKEKAEDIQSRQQLESAAKQVANLKQNIGYLGSQWQPWVSAAKLDAVSNQVALANKTYNDVVAIDQLNKANRQLGQESHAIQFTRQMTQLQDDLDSKVNKQIQWALNQFNAAELKGKLDTIPEIEAFQQQLYAQLDGDLSSIMDTNIEARKFLIERYDKLAESQKTQMANAEKAKQENEKRKNTINKEMSQARGYFVNDNGEPVIDQQTGARIVVPPETTTNYDASSGQLIMITKNPDGTVGVQMKQVGTPKNQSSYQKIGTNPDTGEDIYGFVNAQQGTVTPYSGATGWSIDRNSATQKYGSTPAVRNFNPGNIMDTGFGGQKVPGERFTRFDTPQEWFNALVSKIQNIQNGGSQVYSPDMTLLQYISKYAPAADNNNPQSYSGAIAKNLGISTNTKIRDIDATKLAMEHARHEDGNSFRMLQDLGITGKQKESFDQNKDATYKAYLESGKLPTGMKEWTSRWDNFIDQATAWKTANPDYISKDEKKDLSGIQNNIATDARRKDFLALSSKSKTLEGIQDRLSKWTATPQDKQQLINDFAKILDPTSVVREWEYALAGKYSQNKIYAMKQEISNYFSTNWPLSNDAAKMLAEWVARRHIAIKQANDEAIDEGLANAKYLMWRDIPPEWVGAKYSDINPKAKLQATQKKLGTTWGLQSFMSELTTLLQ